MFFSDAFGLKQSTVEDYGAFDVSLVADLPLFIDPFLLFNSKKREYKDLHKSIIRYLKFLKKKSEEGDVQEHNLRYWYCFPEVKQNWFGFTEVGNSGHGLGIDFARNLHSSLDLLFGNKKSSITKGTHLEKIFLLKKGVGKDNISDFVTNLIKNYLYSYTEKFALEHLTTKQRKRVSINNAEFDFEQEVWKSKTYVLPWFQSDHIVLTPVDMLTRDDTWINKSDLYTQFLQIPQSIPDDVLRGRINDHFIRSLNKRPGRRPTKREREDAILKTIRAYPELVDYFIKMKEDSGDQAKRASEEKVNTSRQVFLNKTRELLTALDGSESFSRKNGSYKESIARAGFLKDVIENKGGHKIFYARGALIAKEEDIQIMFRLAWFGTNIVVTAEANDGRGPADFKISTHAKDNTIVEFKLASNSQLKRNLAKQTDVYRKASNARRAISVIIFFSAKEESRVQAILKELHLQDKESIILIDARKDNKPSGSKA